MATMNDIAKAAGVSRGTVSNVLNGRGCVSYEKIRMVEDAAARLGYSLDKRASTLRKGVSGSIALIIPDISEKKYSDIYMGVLGAAKGFDCKVCLYISGDQPYREREVILEAMREKVMGVLTVSCLEDGRAEYAPFLTADIPVVFLERQGTHQALCSYTFDMEEAARLVSSVISQPLEVCLLSDSLSFRDQLALKTGLQRLLHLEDGSIYENNHGELSPSSYQLAADHPHADYCIAGSGLLARLAENAYTRFTGSSPCIICLSPLTALPDNHYINIQLNYRYLGMSAAEALMNTLNFENPLTSRIFMPSGVCYGSRAVMPKDKDAKAVCGICVKGGCTLRMLAHNTPTISALKTLIPQFTRSTGIEVEIIAAPLSELLNKAESADDCWDIIRVDPSSLSHMAPGILLPLEEADRDAGSHFRHLLDSIPGDYSRFNGTLYAYPFDVSMQLLFYRKSLFESVAQQRAFYEGSGNTLKVPTTYGELETVARFFTRAYRSDSPTPYGSSIAAYTSQTSVTSEYLPRLISAGGLAYTPKGMINLQTDAAITALKDYIRFSRYADTAHTQDWSEVATGFVNGSYATTILYLHYASRFVRAEGAAFNGDIGFAPLPGNNSLLAGGSLGVGRFSGHAAEACRFIQWATGPDIAPALVMLGGISSSAIVYEQQDIIDLYPWLKYLAEHIKDGISRPLLSFRSFSYDQKEFECQLGQRLLDALNGRKTPEQALADAQEYLRSLSS